MGGLRTLLLSTKSGPAVYDHCKTVGRFNLKLRLSW